MKKWIFLPLIVCLLAGCCAVPSVGEPQQLPGAVISSIESTECSPSSQKEYRFATVTKDGTEATIQVSVNAAQCELMMKTFAQSRHVSYPKMEQQTDGTMEFVTVEIAVPQNFTGLTYPRVVRDVNGGFRVITVDKNGDPVTNQKTATKTIRFYSADGTLQWTMSVTATFTYDGLSVTCSDISTAVEIENKDSWCVKEKTASESVPSLDVTFGRITLGVITSTPEFSLVLECDSFGNLS